jgi:uncharacterized membrane protein
MKYSVGIDINKPIDETVRLYENPDNLKEWMEGLQSIEVLSGEPGAVGSKAKLYFKMGKREIEMLETITKKDLPSEFAATYEAKGVYNIVSNRFAAIDESTTRLTNHQEFRFSGFMKIMGFFMPGAFKKQSLKYLEDFKRFAESQ